ncbi:MAG: 2-C-methyl-D-erythritol 4-phosphate cytidylyltransferase [Bacteroidales bacterium]|nr:2-C-methyl-D-erythritol 4-phosphate cytidylyltransferase [Bacteroidales bacterium]MBR3526639.1 2-C-methyl-D-erythritol 4-phosphate cytidylyltransferase [Bacteroidales bacterium]
MDRKRYAVIVAAGSGARMNSKIPKQFIEIAGKPILRHTIERFLAMSPAVEIIVVLSDEYKDYWKNYCRSTAFLERYTLPSGGFTRFHSVKNALEYVPDGALVAVHDGVRPFVTTEFLEGLFEEAERCGAVAPVVPLVESIREKTEDGTVPADRSRFVAVQTPQVFRSEILRKAYGQSYDTSFTDDLTVVQKAGFPVKTVAGLRYNIKITTPDDLRIAEALL